MPQRRRQRQPAPVVSKSIPCDVPRSSHVTGNHHHDRGAIRGILRNAARSCRSRRSSSESSSGDEACIGGDGDVEATLQFGGVMRSIGTINTHTSLGYWLPSIFQLHVAQKQKDVIKDLCDIITANTVAF